MFRNMGGLALMGCGVRSVGVMLALAVFDTPAAAAAPLTLAQAQEQALKRNSDVRVAAAQAEAAAAQLRAAREFSNPTLSLSVAKIATGGTGNGTMAGNRFFDRSYDSIVALSQLVELGKRGPRQESAHAGQRAAEAQRDDVRRLVLRSVRQAYVAALEAREESRVLATSAASLRREAELAAVRLKAGDIAASDRAQIAIAAGRLELDAAAARQAAATAVVMLETLLGEPAPVGTTELTDTLATLPLPSVALAEEQPVVGPRPDVAAAEASLAKADADLQLQKRAPRPDLTVSAQFERNPPDQPNTAGVGVSFPLPLWNRNRGAIHAARAARDVAQAQLDKTRLQAAADVAASRLAFREARARASIYVEQLQPQSASVAHTVAYAYEHGGASLLELFAAERNDNEIRVAAARAQADAASAAFALSAALNYLAAGGEGIPSR